MGLKTNPSPEQVLQSLIEANPGKSELDVTSFWGYSVAKWKSFRTIVYIDIAMYASSFYCSYLY